MSAIKSGGVIAAEGTGSLACVSQPPKTIDQSVSQPISQLGDVSRY
jgi:hypothetical protein